MYHLALKIAGRYLSPLQMHLLKFSLSIRAHSPAVEMFNMVRRLKYLYRNVIDRVWTNKTNFISVLHGVGIFFLIVSRCLIVIFSR